MRHVIEKWDMYEFDCSFDGLIQKLQDLQKGYPDKELSFDSDMESVPYEEGERAVFEVVYFD